MKYIWYKGRLIPRKNFIISTNELPEHKVIDRQGTFVICRETATGELFFYSEHEPLVYVEKEAC
jgi:hypothetical protein